LLKPAILKPVPRWTGKQVISTILKNVVEYGQDHSSEARVGLNLEAPSKLPSDVWGPYGKEETLVIVRDNELLQGVLDKAHIGNAEFGLVHTFYELYSAKLTGKFFSCLARLLTVFLQMHGFTCGMDDLILDKKVDAMRYEKIEKAHQDGVKSAARYANVVINLPHSLMLCNRPTFTLNRKGRYINNVLDRQPEVEYISKDNEILHHLQKKLVMESKHISTTRELILI
jgi:DNA-directed RNA polymerase I subunit RPA1